MELLSKLYEIHSKSGNERIMTEFVAKCCANLGAKTRIDENGNVLAIKGASDTYPCVVAHLDQVQSQHAHDFKLRMEGNIIYAFSERSRGQQGLGADDKNGIWVALKALARFDVLKVAFFVGEEIGCVGSSKVDMKFFDDCRFVLQCDRKGGSDLITTASWVELCGDDFVDAVKPEDFGYKTTTGLMTDVMELKERGLNVACCNISCGYYHPHTDNEVTDISELKNCFNFVCSIIKNCTEVYNHTFTRKWEPKKSTYHRSFLGDDDYDYYNSYYGDYYGNRKSSVIEEEEDEELMYLEDEVMTDCYSQLDWYPKMSFRTYWKNYGKAWGLKKRRTKEIFDEVKRDLDRPF